MLVCGGGTFVVNFARPPLKNEKDMEYPVYLGTKLKYLVTITAAGFSMVEHNFDIVLSKGQKSKKFEKDELVFDGENYFLAFDTSDFGVGDLSATVTAYVPDADFSDGIRTEIFKMKLTNIKA